MNLTLKQLEYFNQIAKYENLSQAAKTLGITQPALSAALKKIERSLDLQLFDRGGGGMTLTRAGKVLPACGGMNLCCCSMTLTRAGKVLRPKISQLLGSYQRAFKLAEKIATNQKTQAISLLIPTCPWTNTLRCRLANDSRFTIASPAPAEPQSPSSGHDCDVAITCHYHPLPEHPDYGQAEILTVRGLSSVMFAGDGHTSLSSKRHALGELLVPAESKLQGITQLLREGLADKVGNPEMTIEEFQCFDSLVASCHSALSMGILPGPARVWRSIYGKLLDIRDLDDFASIKLTVTMTALRSIPQTVFDELVALAKVSMRKLPPRKRLPLSGPETQDPV